MGNPFFLVWRISGDANVKVQAYDLKDELILTLIYLGGDKFAPRQFFATAQKRLALDCWNFVASIVSLLHNIWYTFWSPGT